MHSTISLQVFPSKQPPIAPCDCVLERWHIRFVNCSPFDVAIDPNRKINEDVTFKRGEEIKIAFPKKQNGPVEVFFHLKETDLYPPIPTKKVIVDQNIDDLRVFSIEIGVNYRILKEMNPWLRKDYLNLKSREEYIREHWKSRVPGYITSRMWTWLSPGTSWLYLQE